MLERNTLNEVLRDLSEFPAVALLGCRQVGKTTLAEYISKIYKKPSQYLDLELTEDREKLSEPQLFLEKQEGKLLILDEIHRVPELFPILRGLIDKRRKKGEKSAQFLILGSASPELLKQSSESLAGRISYIELNPFNVLEAKQSGFDDYLDRLWVRGGFPDSFFTKTEESSLRWRDKFIRTYVEQDIPQIGPNFPADRVFKLWKMLAFDQGAQTDLTKIAANLSISTTTVKNYIDTLASFFLIRKLQPWHGNSKKRLVKTPKIYVRDSGLLHALTNIGSYNDIISHPLCGASWEGFVIEQILQNLPYKSEASYYRTSAGAEIDLVIETAKRETFAIEIKRTLSPKVSTGFKNGCEDIKPDKRYYVIPRGEAYPIDKNTQAIGLKEFLQIIAK
jgi:predicted AAA+ superfamily ATPase